MKLMDAFRIQLLRGSKAILEPIGSVPTLRVRDAVSGVPLDITQEHDIGVEWKARVFCRPEDAPHALDNIVRAFKESAYGHLRERVLRLDMALTEYDWQRARMECRDLLSEIMDA